MQSKSIPKQVFISHEKNDKELRILARKLANELQQRGYKIWTDENIISESMWSEEIKRALDESDSMIALLNRHSFSSSYVRDILEHVFFDDRYKNRLLPVLFGSLSEKDFSQLPWVLRNMTFLKMKERRSTYDRVRRIADKFEELINRQGTNHDA